MKMALISNILASNSNGRKGCLAGFLTPYFSVTFLAYPRSSVSQEHECMGVSASFQNTQYITYKTQHRNTRTKFLGWARGYKGLGQIARDESVRKRLELDAHIRAQKCFGATLRPKNSLRYRKIGQENAPQVIAKDGFQVQLGHETGCKAICESFGRRQCAYRRSRFSLRFDEDLLRGLARYMQERVYLAHACGV